MATDDTPPDTPQDEQGPLPRTREAVDWWLTLRVLYRRVAQEIAAALDHGAVLDVGTGPGRLPIELATLAPGLHVTGVDLSPGMVNVARGHASKRRLQDRATFLTGNAAALPVPDASFDLVVSTLSVHHWDDQAAGLRELHRAMRPSGVTWVFDMYSPGIQQAFEELIAFSPFTTYTMSRVKYGRWALLKIAMT